MAGPASWRIVIYANSGTGNSDETITPGKAKEISMYNTGAASLTFTIRGITINVPAGITFDDAFADFHIFTIAATDTWQYVVRG